MDTDAGICTLRSRRVLEGMLRVGSCTYRATGSFTLTALVCPAGTGSGRGKSKEPPEEAEQGSTKRSRAEGNSTVEDTAEEKEEREAAEDEANHQTHLRQLARHKHAMMVMLKQVIGPSSDNLES